MSITCQLRVPAEHVGWTQLGGVAKARWAHVYTVPGSDCEGILLIEIIARVCAPMP